MALVMAPTGMPGGQDLAPGRSLVIDTNIVLDLLVFDDPAGRTLYQALVNGTLEWLVTPSMRDEVERVLGYAQIRMWLGSGATRDGVLAQFDQLSRTVAVPPRAAVRCTDADDQIFIDLAVAYRATLVSKDRAVLSLRKRLAALGVRTTSTLQDA